jgi:hypothetical protein
MLGCFPTEALLGDFPTAQRRGPRVLFAGRGGSAALIGGGLSQPSPRGRLTMPLAADPGTTLTYVVLRSTHRLEGASATFWSCGVWACPSAHRGGGGVRSSLAEGSRPRACHTSGSGGQQLEAGDCACWRACPPRPSEEISPCLARVPWGRVQARSLVTCKHAHASEVQAGVCCLGQRGPSPAEPLRSVSPYLVVAVQHEPPNSRLAIQLPWVREHAPPPEVRGAYRSRGLAPLVLEGG